MGDVTSIGVDLVLNHKYHDMTIKEVKVLLSTLLPNYLMPTKVRILDSLPQTASGKMIRRKQ